MYQEGKNVADGAGAVPTPVRPVPAPSVTDQNEHSLANLLSTLYQERWLMVAIVVGTLALGALYVLGATPVYRSDVVVQVEESRKSIAGLTELSEALGERAPPADTEIELIHSRSLVGSVVADLGLDIVAAPVRFPVLGRFAAKRHLEGPAAPPFGLAPSYAWGGESIRVDRLDVGEAYLGKPLTLVARRGSGYEIQGKDGHPIVTGVVGSPAAGGSGARHVALFVAELTARPGTRFQLVKQPMQNVVDALRKKLRVNEAIKKSGIIDISLDDADPQRLAKILNATASRYVRSNVEQRSAEASKTLQFLESQLPVLRANLEAAESARKAYQVRKGTVDLTTETSSMLDRVVDLERAISEAQLQRSDLRQRFTERHPALQALASKIDKLRQERAALDAKLRGLPGTEVDSARLTRDVRVASELYSMLLNKAQELRVVKSGTIGNVRLVDAAEVPLLPVAPNAPLVLALALVLGVTLASATAVTRRVLYDGVDDPEALERATGLGVYAVIPRSEAQATSLSRVGRRRDQPLLAAVRPTEPAVESLRSLRTALQFSLLEAKSNVIVITAPTPAVGKSFVSANLAQVLAAAGSRVLLVDGDLRRGGLHRFFGGKRQPGLSDLLSGSATSAEAVRRAPWAANLDWLATGRIPPNPTELLASERFERILSELASRYDVVLIDTAPVLPVTDAALIGRCGGINVLVLGAGMHTAREIVATIKRLGQNGVRVHGAVLNDLSGIGARHSKYRYEYRYTTAPAST